MGTNSRYTKGPTPGIPRGQHQTSLGPTAICQRAHAMYRSRTSASYSTPRGRLQIHQEKLQRHRIQLQIHNQGQRQVRLHGANSKHSREPTSGVSVPTPNTVRTSLQYVNLGRGGHALFILFALFKKTICNSHNLTPSLVGQCSVRDVFFYI